jgi:hypothetical protein
MQRDKQSVLNGSKGEKHRAVPGGPTDRGSILEAWSPIGQQMIVVVQIVGETAAQHCRGAAAGGVSALVEDFHAQRQTIYHFARQDRATQAKIPRCAAAVQDTPASAKSRPSAKIALRPNRNQQRRMVVTYAGRSAWQKYARKNADIETTTVLVQETIFRGQFDIAEAGAASFVVGERHNRCELQVGGAAIVEIDTRLARRSLPKAGAQSEGIDLEMPIFGRFRIVRDIRRPCPGSARRK